MQWNSKSASTEQHPAAAGPGSHDAKRAADDDNVTCSPVTPHLLTAWQVAHLDPAALSTTASRW
eukprot:SAG31_NODE_4633_length_3083_cov_5.088807_3_plen_64_part_00